MEGILGKSPEEGGREERKMMDVRARVRKKRWWWWWFVDGGMVSFV